MKAVGPAMPEREAEAETAVAARETAGAARQTAGAAQVTKGAAERTVELAADRTVLAAERTYAAWVRTGLLALASGIGAHKLLDGVVPGPLVLATGTVLILFSAFSFGAGVWRQVTIGPTPPSPDVKALPPVLLAVVNGFLALVALAALVGVWLGRAAG